MCSNGVNSGKGGWLNKKIVVVVVFCNTFSFFHTCATCHNTCTVYVIPTCLCHAWYKPVLYVGCRSWNSLPLLSVYDSFRDHDSRKSQTTTEPSTCADHQHVSPFTIHCDVITAITGHHSHYTVMSLLPSAASAAAAQWSTLNTEAGHSYET